MPELSLNVLDIAQNSIKAGAKNINIEVSQVGNRLKIKILDDGCGMSSETLEHALDPFYTTRTTRKVGLGLSFFKESALQTGGKFKITSDTGIGTDIVAEYDASHIDCIPLGDINATILQLVMFTENVDFTYKRKVGKKSFTLSTKKLKRQLGEKDLATSEIAADISQYIKEYLEKNEKEVTAGIPNEGFQTVPRG